MGTGKRYNYDDILNIFFLETREMLDDMESSLLELEKDIQNEEYIHAVFRAAHTVKGSAGMFDYEDISNFAHVVENLLDDVRKGRIPIDDEMIALLLDCHDIMLKMTSFFEANRKGKLSGAMKKEAKILVNRLDEYLQPEEPLAKTQPGIDDNFKDEDSGRPVLNKYWHISLRFGEDTFRNGFDPQSFISYLAEMGEIVNIKTIFDSMPQAEEMNPESCYMGLEIDFSGNTNKESLEDVFEFIKEDCRIRILPPGSSISEYVKLIEELPERAMTIGNILTEIGTLTENELQEALKLQAEYSISREEKKLLGEIVVEEKMVQKDVLDEALKKQIKIKKSMRVDTDKLDNLINLIGELVINASNIKQMSERIRDDELDESVSSLTTLIENIRDNSMNLRMVQLEESFRRFERMVRDLSRSQGKDVDLILSGGETELDKTLIEKIMDPLMHIVRNAVDHGIDTPDKRISMGKPPRGKIFISAHHETGSVVIEVRDDGNGLNRSKILARAIEQGLLLAEDSQNIPDNRLFQFVFMPGFSTAEKVTSVSGRGVGMDVVKKNIESLRGTVIIQSTEGKGTIIRIHLPLTLSIIESFMIKAGSNTYVLPLDMVKECAEISAEKLKSMDIGNFINLRGELIPFLRLRDFFHIEGERPSVENIIIIEYARKKAGIVADRSLGQMQTVVKPLGRIFSRLHWISGATILGSGDVALILDVPRVIQYIQALESKGAK